MLDSKGNLKVSDFGFSNTISTTSLLKTSCGSPIYAAPEVIFAAKGFSGPPCDVWSCGVILYVMLTGFLPFDDDPTNPEGANVIQLYKYICHEKVQIPDDLKRKFKSQESFNQVRDLISGILEPNPNLRLTIKGICKSRQVHPSSSY